MKCKYKEICLRVKKEGKKKDFSTRSTHQRPKQSSNLLAVMCQTVGHARICLTVPLLSPPAPSFI